MNLVESIQDTVACSYLRHNPFSSAASPGSSRYDFSDKQHMTRECRSCSCRGYHNRLPRWQSPAWPWLWHSNTAVCGHGSKPWCSGFHSKIASKNGCSSHFIPKKTWCCRFWLISPRFQSMPAVFTGTRQNKRPRPRWSTSCRRVEWHGQPHQAGDQCACTSGRSWTMATPH